MKRLPIEPVGGGQGPAAVLGAVPAGRSCRLRGPTWSVRAWTLLATLGAASLSAAQPVGTGPAEEPAAEAADSLEDIDLLTLEVPMVVTAGRREQKITTVPYAMSVITAEDIRAAGARSVPDALRLVPGMDVADIVSGTTAVSARGNHGALDRWVLVLVDGRQIYDPVIGATFWGSWPFQLEDIERIEVIRGPGGVTWGANAVQGVINIVTRKPQDQQGLTVTGLGGSRGWQKEHVGYGFSDGRLSLRVSGEYEGSDGFRKGGSFLRRLDDDHKAGRESLHAVYELGPQDTLTLSFGSAQLDGGYATPAIAGMGFATNAGTQSNYAMARLEHRVSEDHLVTLTSFFNDFWFCPGMRQVDYRYQQYALQFGETFKSADNNTFTWGIDTRADYFDTGNSDPPMMSNTFVGTGIVGLYAQNDWQFAPQWTLSLGARMDYEFYGGWLPSARAALSYSPTSTSAAYAAVSRTGQIPTAGFRFLHMPVAAGLGYVTGRRELPNSTATTYELGYRIAPLPGLDLDANLYWQEMQDMIAMGLDPGPPGLFQFSYDRESDQSLYGVELNARYRVNSRLTLLGHYTLEKMNWRSSEPYVNMDLITPPRHKFMVAARYTPVDPLRLSAHLYFVDRVAAPNPGNPLVELDIPRYFRLDLRAEYEFWKDRATLAVGVRNLLDPDHPEGATSFTNNAEVPRMVYAEVRMTLK